MPSAASVQYEYQSAVTPLWLRNHLLLVNGPIVVNEWSLIPTLWPRVTTEGITLLTNWSTPDTIRWLQTGNSYNAPPPPSFMSNCALMNNKPSSCWPPAGIVCSPLWKCNLLRLMRRKLRTTFQKAHGQLALALLGSRSARHLAPSLPHPPSVLFFFGALCFWRWARQIHYSICSMARSPFTSWLILDGSFTLSSSLTMPLM